MEKPSFELNEISVTRFSSSEIHLRFGIDVHNPNHFDLNVRSVQYVIILNEREAGQGQILTEVAIPQRASNRLQVPLQADLRNLGPLLNSLLTGEPLRYKIQGSAVVKAGLGTATFPFSKSGEIKIRN